MTDITPGSRLIQTGRWRRGAAILALLAISSWSVMAVAQPAADSAAGASDEATSGTIDPQARKIVDEMSQALKGASGLQFDLGTSMSVTMGEMKQEQSTTYQVAAKRPKNLALLLQEGNGFTIVINETSATVYMPAQKMYQLRPAPEKLEELTQGAIPEIGALGPAAAVTVAFVSDDPAKVLLDGVTSGTYVGKETVDGKAYHHVMFGEEAFDWDLRVAADGPALPYRWVPDISRAMAANPPQGGPQGGERPKLTAVAQFTNWQTGEVPASKFQFTPPAEAKEVKADAGGPAGQADEPADPLLGKPAPDFKLSLLEGGEIDLAKLKSEKKIVILDFWASWCGPCRRGLPIVTEVANSFKDKGVVFYAVNLREKKDVIEKFLKDAKLGQFAVALDAEGDVSDKYGVEGIPHTVIIGKDGTVQQVHHGFSPGLKQEMTESLEQLVAGKNLATAAAGQKTVESEAGAGAAGSGTGGTGTR